MIRTGQLISALLYCLLFAGPYQFSAQAQSYWLKSYGGSGDDNALAICTSTTGGYFLACEGPTPGIVSVLKLRENGDVEADIQIGISQLRLAGIAATADGGCFLVGTVTASDSVSFVGMRQGGDDIFVYRLGADGKIVWRRIVGSRFSESATSVVATQDGGCMIAGYTNRDVHPDERQYDNMLVTKILADGTTEWTRTYGGEDNDGAYSIAPLPDGGYVVVGMTASEKGDLTGPFALSRFQGVSDVAVMRITSAGDMVWTRLVGGTGTEEGRSVSATSDGSIYVVGVTTAGWGDFQSLGLGWYDAFVVKLDISGSILWKRVIGGVYEDWARSVATTEDGGCVVVGYTNSLDRDFADRPGRFNDAFVRRLHPNGQTRWTQTIGGGWLDYGNTVVSTLDGGFAVAGQFASNNGAFDGMLPTTGHFDAYVAKLTKDGGYNAATSVESSTEERHSLVIAPNPFVSSTNVRFSTNQPQHVRIDVVDMLGNVVAVVCDTFLDAGHYQRPLSDVDLASGLYTVRLTAGSTISTVCAIVSR